MRYYEHLATNGGMCTCGDHLGVFVGTTIEGCPKGWVYVPLEDATPSLVKEAIREARTGRAKWPPAEIVEPVKKKQQKKKCSRYL